MTQAQAVVLHWHGGGEAQVLQTDGVHATLHSTRQAAPGTPLTADVTLESGKSVRFKVKGCRRVDEATYELFGRWVDLSKKMREELARA